MYTVVWVETYHLLVFLEAESTMMMSRLGVVLALYLCCTVYVVGETGDGGDYVKDRDSPQGGEVCVEDGEGGVKCPGKLEDTQTGKQGTDKYM